MPACRAFVRIDRRFRLRRRVLQRVRPLWQVPPDARASERNGDVGADITRSALATMILRVATAMIAGAVVGVVYDLGLFFAPIIRHSGLPLDHGSFLVMIFVSSVAFVGWIFGLLALALPIWSLLHVCGVRSWPAAIALGSVLACLAELALRSGIFAPTRLGDYGNTSGDIHGLIWVHGRLTAYGWLSTAVKAAARAPAGAFVGWIIWRIAYPRH